eukprot:14113703-Heterocapsa_arctica.AAC.1
MTRFLMNYQPIAALRKKRCAGARVHQVMEGVYAEEAAGLRLHHGPGLPRLKVYNKTEHTSEFFNTPL